jgi:4-amino-4-deoxy-L-arabinose transferase-like glycosyltransferase
MLPIVVAAAVRDWWAPDEPRYAQVAREIYETGQFLVMHLCGSLYPDKPPLLYWSSGFFGWLTGWNELAMRVPSLVATFLTAWLVARIAGRWWGAAAARWSPAVFLTFAMVTEIGGRLQIDPLLTLLTTAALELVTRGDTSPRATLRVLAAGVLVGLGGLAKGPVALVNVGLPIAMWAWLGPRRALPRVRPAAWVAAIVIGIAIPVVWAVAAALQEPALWSELFFGQHAGRVTQADRHPGPPWKNLLRMPSWLLPWTGAVIAGLVRAWRDRRSSTPSRDGLLLAAAWLAVLFVFYSAIPPKRDLYLLPAYPAAALLGGWIVADGIRRGALSRWITWTVSMPLVVLGAAVCGAAFATDVLPGLAWRGPAAGLPLVVGGVASLVSLRRGPREWAHAVVVTWAVFATVVALALMPPMDPLKSARGVALELAARPERPTAIGCYGVQPEGYRFYSDGRAPTVRGEDLAADLEREGDDFLALVHSDEWQTVAPALKARMRILSEHQVGSKTFVVVGAEPTGR